MKVGDWVRTNQLNRTHLVGPICEIRNDGIFPFIVDCVGTERHMYTEEELELLSDEEAMLRKLEW
jgi:hypothetical protein